MFPCMKWLLDTTGYKSSQKMFHVLHMWTYLLNHLHQSKYRPYWQADMELEMKWMHNLMPRLLDVYGAMLFFIPQLLSTVSFRLHQMKLCDTFLSAATVSWWYHQKQRHNGSHAIIPKLMRWLLNAYDASVNSDVRDVVYCTSLSQTATVSQVTIKTTQLVVDLHGSAMAAQAIGCV